MTTILDWLKSLRHRPPHSALKYGVTIADFKRDSGRVKAMAGLYSSRIFQNALSVVATSAPPGDVPPKDSTQAIFSLGVASGVKQAMAMLKFLGEPEVKYEEVKPDWGVPDEGDSEITTP